jgi:hypothetical protein
MLTTVVLLVYWHKTRWNFNGYWWWLIIRGRHILLSLWTWLTVAVCGWMIWIYNGELHSIHFLPYIVMTIKWTTMRQPNNIAYLREMINAFWSGNLQESGHLGDVGIVVRIIQYYSNIWLGLKHVEYEWMGGNEMAWSRVYCWVLMKDVMNPSVA